MSVGEDSNHINGKRAAGADGDVPPKKRQKSQYSIPTSIELNHMRETEMLYHSSLFRFQVEEMLSEIKPKQKYSKLIKEWVKNLKDYLGTVDDVDDVQLDDQSWLESLKIQVPVEQKPYKLDGLFRYKKPSTIEVIGSYAIGASTGKVLQIDIQLELPKPCLQYKDLANYRYHRKRALYMAYTAAKLRQAPFVKDLAFTLHIGDQWRPILRVVPTGKLGEKISFNLIPTIPDGFFSLSKLYPQKFNVKSDWFLEKELSENPATPHYNSSILVDLTFNQQKQLMQDTYSDKQNLKDALILLKVWLRQRELDQGYGAFSGYIMAAYLVWLLQNRKINTVMSSYQIIRSVWNSLSSADWCNKGISLAPKQESGPSLQEFHQHFEVVFVDITGSLNYCANMSRLTFHRVKWEAAQAIRILDDSVINSFDSLFMVQAPFLYCFDHVLHFHSTAAMKKCVLSRATDAHFLNFGKDYIPIALSLIVPLVERGLHERVKLTAVQLTPSPCWNINEKPQNTAKLTLGFIVNPRTAGLVLDKGPEGCKPEAREFQAFWGEKSTLRKFKDGLTCEAVVWNANTVSERRLICQQVMLYLLKTKLGLEARHVRYIAGQLDSLITVNNKTCSLQYGTGEEASEKLNESFNELARELRELKGLELRVESIKPVSAVFRGTETFPQLPFVAESTKNILTANSRCLIFRDSVSTLPQWIEPMNVILDMETSSKWPSEPEAIQRIKAAFNMKIGALLRKQFRWATKPDATHVDVFKDGYIFRLRTAYRHEAHILRTVKLEDGSECVRENGKSQLLDWETKHMPYLAGLLRGLNQQYSSYGRACALAKRWISAQMLSDHVPEECVDLLVAHLYVNPSPFVAPCQPQLAFIRFLRLLSSTDWQAMPIILNVDNSITSDEIKEIESKFLKERDTLPCIFIACAADKFQSLFTEKGPSNLILRRLTHIAKESLVTISSQLLDAAHSDYKVIFRPPADYNVLIHIDSVMNPKTFQAVDNCTCVPHKTIEFFEKGGRVPVAGFNPIQLYIKELRESYDEYAHFFHDASGGNTIGVVWKKPAFDPMEFKVMNIAGRKIGRSKDGQTMIEANLEAIVEDFSIIGEGLVRSVEIK